jgi:O-acetyl-ADP-ribose deacetylase (regulator of RNase III)
MKIVKGNLLDLAEQGHFHIIVQGCNCFNTMGSGLAKEIRERYPEAWKVDQETHSGDYNKLGNYTSTLGMRYNIINAYTQYDFSRGTDVFEYTAFALILQKLAHKYPTCDFGFPKIGCGLAGGNETVIMEMLQKFSDDLSLTGGTVTIVEFA